MALPLPLSGRGLKPGNPRQVCIELRWAFHFEGFFKDFVKGFVKDFVKGFVERLFGHLLRNGTPCVLSARPFSGV